MWCGVVDVHVCIWLSGVPIWPRLHVWCATIPVTLHVWEGSTSTDHAYLSVPLLGECHDAHPFPNMISLSAIALPV